MNGECLFMFIFIQWGSTVGLGVSFNNSILLKNNFKILKKNFQIRQIQKVPKKSTEYTEEERSAFPRLFQPSADFLEEWRQEIEPETWEDHPRLKRGEYMWDRNDQKFKKKRFFCFFEVLEANSDIFSYQLILCTKFL